MHPNLHDSNDDSEHDENGDALLPPSKRPRGGGGGAGGASGPQEPQGLPPATSTDLMEHSFSDGGPSSSSSAILRASSLPSPTLQLTGHTGSVYAVAYSPNGDTLCSASFDTTCLLWNHHHREDDNDGRQCYNNFNVLQGGHKNAVLDCAWNTNDAIVTCSADKTVQLWDVATGQRVRKWKHHDGIVNAVSAVSGRALVASVSDDGSCKLWDARHKQPTSTLTTDYPVLAVALNDTDQVFTAGIENMIHCWDVKMSRKVYSLKGHTDTITGLSVHPRGTHLLSNSMDQTLRTWDIQPYCPGKRQCKTFVGHKHGAERGLLKCAWSPNGSLVTCGSADKLVHVWDEYTAEELYLLPGHQGCVNAVSFHPREANILVSGSSDKVIFVGELS